MIPKKIHYCWFGKGSIPKSIMSYIQYWKEKLPDYEFKEWNESNFNINITRFTKEAYAINKYAFVSDYVRLYALYHEGGIYLDTDIEIIKTFNPFINNISFLGFEMHGKQIATSVIGSQAKQQWIKDLMKYYETKPFIKWWGKLNSTPNPIIFETILKGYGIEMNDKEQHLKNNIHLYPSSYFCAKDYFNNKILKTSETICIHHYAASWVLKENNIKAKIKRGLNYIKIKINLVLFCKNS